MAVDMFLKLDDVKGESHDKTHKDTIDVLSWSWGMSQTGTTHVGGGGGAGKVKVQDITILKHVDKASPNLILACCTGKHYKEALLTVRKAGEKPLDYLKITMKEVLVSSVQPSGNHNDDRISESLTLNFAEYKIEYTPQKADGSGDAAVEAAFNIAQNTKI